MVPSDTGIKFKAVFLLVVQIESQHLGCRQSLSSSTEAATATTGESHIIHVVGTHGDKYLQVGALHSCKDSATITTARSCCQVGIHHISPVHATLDTEVENSFLLTIVNTAHSRQITLLVIGSYALNDRGGQVLHGSLRVACHKFLTVNQNFLHLLTVNGYLSIVVHLGTRQFLHQFLHYGALRCAVSRGIIYKGVFLQRHLGSLTSHRGTLQHDGIRFQFNGPQGDILVSGNLHILGVWFESHTGHLYNIITISRCFNAEDTVKIGERTRHHRTIRLQQSHRGLRHRFLRVTLNHLSRNVSLSYNLYRRYSHEQE